MNFLAIPVRAAAVLLGVCTYVLNAPSGTGSSRFSLTNLEKMLTIAATGIHGN